jgi:tetratricopeptide (TPR) repeat protein
LGGVNLSACQARRSAASGFAGRSQTTLPPTFDPFREAVNKATVAAEQAQIATTGAEWEQVAALWQEAIEFMAVTSPTHPHYSTAQQKMVEYQEYLTYAQQLQAQERSLSADDPFRAAVNKATAAAEKTQTAKTKAEWDTVARLWQQAISLMQATPETSENFWMAQEKAMEYQKNYDYAIRSGNAVKSRIVVTPQDVAAAKGFYQRALENYLQQNLKDALTNFDRAIAQNPNFALAYYNRGIVKFRLDDNVGAIQDLQKAADLYAIQGDTRGKVQAQNRLQEIQSVR